MSAVAAPPSRAPPPAPTNGITSSSSKNQRLADALSSSDAQRHHPFSFPRRAGTGDDHSHSPSPFHSTASSEADDQFQDVEDELAQPHEMSQPLTPASPGHYLSRSGRTSVDTHWDETEFQRHAADRNSKCSAVTRYEDDDDDDDGDDGIDPEEGYNGASGDYDARSTYGHARNTSVGSSIWAGKGAAVQSPPAPSASSRKKKHQQQEQPPPLPTSSVALQQLRDRGEAGASAPRDPSSQLQVNAPSSGGLSSAYNSPNPSDGGRSRAGSSVGHAVAGDAEFELVNPPVSDSLASKRTMPDGTPYPPMPPVPEKRSASSSQPRKGSSSSSGGRRGRSPILSYDGGVEAEERMINSPNPQEDASQGLKADNAGDGQYGEGSSTLNRSLSHMGPKLRKNEPAPWEMDMGDDGFDGHESLQSSTPFPPSPNTQSAWSRLTRGSLDVREKESTEARRGLGLGVNLRRPSGEMGRRPSGEMVREGPKTTAPSPKAKSRFKSFGGSSGVNERERDGTSPSPHSTLRGSPSITGNLQNANELTSSVTQDGRDAASQAPSRPFSPDSTAPSNASVKQTRARTKSVTSSAANVFKGLGRGGDKKDKHRDDGKESTGLNSNKLAKALKKKGERDELSLAKGISSEDFKESSAPGNEPEPGGSVTGQAAPAVEPAPRSSQPTTPFNSASVRAAVNKDLVNPFASRSSTSTIPSSPPVQRPSPLRGQNSDSANITSIATTVDGGASLERQSLTHSVQGGGDNDASHSIHTAESASSVPLRVSSPRTPHRELSLTAGGMSNLTSDGGHRSSSASPNLPSSRGMGIGYRKANGGISASPTANSTTSFGRAGRRQESSGSIVQAGAPAPSPRADESASDHSRAHSATPTASNANLGHHATLAQQNIERRQAPGSLAQSQPDSYSTSIDATGTDATTVSSTSDTQSTAASSFNPLSASHSTTGLPTPGSHEGVAYKLISLEQAQAQQHAKAREAAVQRAVSGGTGGIHLDRGTSSSSHKSSEHSASVSHEDAGDKERESSSSGKGLKNKKSGILRMFGRGGDKHQQAHEEHASAPAPPLPTMSLPSSTTIKSLDASSALHPSQSVKSHLAPSASSQTLSPAGASNGNGAMLGLSPPALDVLRPVSSMMASMSPGLLDVKKGDTEKVSRSPSEALAALQGNSPAESTEELRPSRMDGDRHRLGAKASGLATARGQSPSAIKVGEWGTAAPLRSPSVASTALTGAEATEFHSPASSPMANAFGETSLRSSGDDGQRGAHTRPLQLVDRQGVVGGRKVSSEVGGGQGLVAGPAAGARRRSSTFSRESETSSQHQLSGLTGGYSSRGSHDARSSSDAVHNRVTEIEAKLGELLAELTHLRSTHAPGVLMPSADSEGGGDGLLSPTVASSKAGNASPLLNDTAETLTARDSSASPIPQSSSPMVLSRSTTPIPPCSSCGCKCAEMKRLQAMNELQVLKNLGSRSPGGTNASILDRGRGVKKRPEEAGRFGAYSGR